MVPTRILPGGFISFFCYSETTENYKCMICANIFDSKESIKEHLKSSHENTEHNENDYELVNEAFNCELCGRYFSYKHHLQHHVERYKNNLNEKMFNLAHYYYCAKSSAGSTTILRWLRK